MRRKLLSLFVLMLVIIFTCSSFSPAVLADTDYPAASSTVTPSDTVPAPSDTPTVTAADSPSDNIPAPPKKHQGGSFTKPEIPDAPILDESMSKVEETLSSALFQLADNNSTTENKDNSAVLDNMKAQGDIRTVAPGQGAPAAEEVHVYIQLNEGADPNAITPYVSKIEDSDYDAGFIAAWVDVTKLEGLASLDEVSCINEVIAPVIYTGSVTSEGDSLLNADKARAAFGVDGTGVKVGVVSNGVDNYSSAVASGDLPDNFGDGNHILSNKKGGDEGTAMLEIVHDLAPGAELYFHDSGVDLDGYDDEKAFCDGIQDLADHGCKVICDDVGWLDQPYFEDGYVATRINQIISQYGIVYCSSAGNFAVGHYQGKFYNDGSNNMDFSRGKNPSDPYLWVEVPGNGGFAEITLEWNDKWGKAGDNYDLYLYGDGGYSVSNAKQNGNGNPFEFIYIENDSEDPIEYYILVHAANSSALKNKKTLELYVYTGGGGYMESDNEVPGDSIFGQAALPGVLACGAVDANSSDPQSDEDPKKYNQIEYYSSQGPVTMISGTRKKPDICGADGVSETGAGGFSDPFYGTSAASPHIAALCALVLDRFPKLTATQVRDVIKGSATDMGTKGFDNEYGNGLADGLAEMNYYHYVTFDCQGGSTVDKQLIKNNSTITNKTPTRSGYSFGGWYTGADLATAWNYKTDKVTSDMTLYAKWAPGTPSIKVKATDYKTVQVTWKAVANAEGYEVWREASGGSYTLIATVTDGSLYYNDKNLQGQIKYYYKVRVYWTEGATRVYGSFSSVKSTTPVWPTVKVKASSYSYDSISLTWTDLSSATSVTGYLVYRSTSKNGPWDDAHKIKDVTGAASYIDVGPLNTNTTYYYKIRAYEDIGGGNYIYSSYSAYAYAKPVWPSIRLTAAPADFDTITLRWNSINGATGYYITRCDTAKGAYSPLYTAAKSDTTYDDNTAVTGKTYYYKIQAFDDTDSAHIKTGPLSAYASAKTAPDKPANLQLSLADGTTITVSWDPAGGATGYEVYRATSLNGKYTRIATPAGTSYDDQNLTVGKTYYYKVRAVVVATKTYGNYSDIKSLKVTPEV